MHKVAIEYKFKRGDTVYFVMYDRMQCTTVDMVIATIHSTTEKDDGKVVYVLDESKLVFPEKKKYQRTGKFENYFSVRELFNTPEEAAEALAQELRERMTPSLEKT